MAQHLQAMGARYGRMYWSRAGDNFQIDPRPRPGLLVFRLDCCYCELFEIFLTVEQLNSSALFVNVTRYSKACFIPTRESRYRWSSCGSNRFKQSDDLPLRSRNSIRSYSIKNALFKTGRSAPRLGSSGMDRDSPIY